MPDPRPTNAPQVPAGGAAPGPASEAATQPAQAPLVDQIPRQFGRYRIIDRIGHGGMGAVFKAHDSQLDRVVALKVPFLGNDGEEARGRFFREARAAATLHHPNVCPVYDVGEFRGMPFLTMAFVEGKGLDRVAKDAPVAPGQAALLVRKIALAMQAAHTNGVIHRDLKPSNVLLRPDGEPVIMDFGLARRDGDKASEGLTRRGDVLGTVEYMSPEQLDADHDAVGPRTDVYALGVLLYELLAGRRPFLGTAAQVMVAIMLKPPPPPSEIRSGVPARLDEICLKAMSRVPADRYESMAAFAADLTEFLRTPRSGTTPAPTPATDPQARANAETRPVGGVTVVSKGSGRTRPSFEVVEPDVPVTTPSGGSKKRKSAKRRKEEQKKSKVPLIAGGIIGAAVLVAVLVVALKPSKPAASVASGDPPAKPADPASDPRPSTVAAPPPTPPAKANFAPTPKTANPPAAQAVVSPKPSGPLVRDEEVSLAVGDRKEVPLPLDRRGYRGPLTIELTAPPELRFTPRGPITLRAGEAPPALAVMLMGEPTGGAAQVAITATPTEGTGATPVSGTLTFRMTPSSCARVLDVGEPVGAMTFTPDASLGLVGVDRPVAKGEKPDGAIRVFDLVAGKPLPPLNGHAGPVLGLVMSAEGKYALSVSADETAALWNLAGGQRVLTTPKLPSRAVAAGLSPDAKRGLIAYTSPGVVLRINLEKFQATGQPIKTVQLMGIDSPEAVLTLAVSGDGKGLAGGIDGKLFLLDMADKVKPKPLTGLKEAVRVAAFSPEAGVAVTGSGGVLRVGKVQPGTENLVTVWDTTATMPRWTADGHAAPVVSVAFSADGSLLASGDEAGEVRVWVAADGKRVGEFKGHAGRVAALAFAPDGKTVLSGSTDRTVRTWRLP